MEKQIKKPNKSLGRGIDALLSQPRGNLNTKNIADPSLIANKNGAQQIIQIPISKLKANPFQPREYFDTQKLQELSESIKQHGILEPLLVSKTNDTNDNSYLIIAGERRFRAAVLAKKETVPALVLELEDEQKLEFAIIENLQREDLNPIEIALSFKSLMSLGKLSQEQLAEKLGLSRPVISNLIRLLTLPEEIQNSIKSDEITQSHARLLLSVNDPKEQRVLYKEIINNKLSVRALENKLNQRTDLKRNKKDLSETIKKDKKNALSIYEQRLIEQLGTKVTIKGTINAGKIHIDYFNQDDLSRILSILNISFD